MIPDSDIDPAILDAYRRCEYRMAAGFVLWVGEYSFELANWQKRRGVDCACFICAVNPRSEPLPDAANEARHEHLRTRLSREGLYFEEGAGIDPHRLWPREPGFLVAGMDQAQARRFGLEFDQNAVLWAGANAVPQLLLLR